MPKSKLIICTDLDGTLLDHHTYSFDAAKPALDLIRELRIPLILNSSKTAAELESIKTSLNINHPFVVENGAGLLVPQNYFSPAVTQDLTMQNGYLIKSHGGNLQQVIECAKQIREKNNYRFRCFSEMAVGEIVKLTGLDRIGADLAKRRLFSEPILWQEGDDRYREFVVQLQDVDIQVQRGGRFCHLSGGSDKGKALLILKQIFTAHWNQTPKVIALGDCENDVAMLQAADIGVWIRSPVNAVPSVTINKPTYISEQIGPSGWNQIVLNLLTNRLKG